MNNLQLRNYQLFIEGSEEAIPCERILEAENTGLATFAQNSFIKPSKSFPSIDFASSSFIYSSVSATIFTPSDNGKKRPRLTYTIKDANFVCHSVSFIPQDADYVIVDNLFCPLDRSQVDELNSVIGGVHEGPIAFSLVAVILAKNSPLISIIRDDDNCCSFEEISIAPTNPNYPLFAYQTQGVTWMNSVLHEGVGLVLADEMGLGKTAQVISVLTTQATNGTSLIIVPSTLKENWKRELNKFSPGLSSFIYGGKDRFVYYKQLEKYDVIITSYDTASSDFSILQQIHWNLIILDEAQAIKNAPTKRSRIIREYPKRAGLAVSGTPFENHIEDVWSIFDFCFRGLLGSLGQFESQFSDTEDSAHAVEQIISPLILRRKVAEVRKDLPEKLIIDKVIEMSDFEAERYETIRQQCAGNSGKPNLGMLQKLRQFCAFPSIVDDSLQGNLPTDVSEKFNYLIEITDSVFQKHEKALIFTGWIKAQNIIIDSLNARYGIKCFVLNGETPQEKRQEVVDDFSSRNGFEIMILNPTVGATGLNITAANHVIFYTLEWNPSQEDQCIGRAARIGQTKTVMVYRLFYCDTVEDVMNERLNRKRQLREITIQGTDGTDEADIMKALSVSPFTEEV